MRTTLIHLMVILFFLLVLSTAYGEKTIRLDLGGQSVEGKLIMWSSSSMYLLGRDGVYWFFGPHDAKNVRTVLSRFYSYSAYPLIR